VALAAGRMEVRAARLEGGRVEDSTVGQPCHDTA
jgi:hypothetical protein